MRTEMTFKTEDGPKQILSKLFRAANFGTGTGEEAVLRKCYGGLLRPFFRGVHDSFEECAQPLEAQYHVGLAPQDVVDS